MPSHYDHRPLRLKQTGVALITVLMVFSIAAILVSKLLLQRSIDAQRVSQMVSRTQANYYARLGEDLAILGLRVEDTIDADGANPNVDTLEEEWTAAPYTFDIDGFSQIAIRIVDLNRFYNLNNMLEPDGSINPDELVRYENLLFELGLDEALAGALADWLDEDDNEDHGFGTESDTYMANELSYRAANRHLYDARELSMIEGYTPEVLEVLFPHVTALEISNILPVNVNTASTPVLATLLESNVAGGAKKVIGLSGAQRIADDRPFEDQAELNNVISKLVASTPAPQPAGANNPPNSRTRTNLNFQGTYFEINVRANYGGATAYLTTVVKQEGVGENAKYTVLKREESDNSARFVQQFR